MQNSDIFELISRATLRFMAYTAMIVISFPSCKKCELVDQEIVYPPKTCSGTFYFIRIDSAMDTNFTFNKLDKPILNPLNSTHLAEPFGLSGIGFNIKSNFLAFDRSDNRHFDCFLYATNVIHIIRFQHQHINPFISYGFNAVGRLDSPSFIKRFFSLQIFTVVVESLTL